MTFPQAGMIHENGSAAVGDHLVTCEGGSLGQVDVLQARERLQPHDKAA